MSAQGLDEAGMFDPMTQYLEENGYEIREINDGHTSGADITASRPSHDLVVEMKGHTQALSTDLRTCIGQICGQIEDGQDEYAIALSESYRTMVAKYAVALKQLGVKVFIVSEAGVEEWESSM